MRARMLIKSTALTVAVLAGSVIAGSNDARAVDLDPVDECRKDISLAFSGQVNRAFLYADNGTVDDFFHVDNDNSSTRLRARAIGRVSCDFKVGAQIEVQFESNTTSAIRFKQSGQGASGANNFTERKLEIWFDSQAWGRLWLGQGDTASNGTSEVDLSGVGVIAYSGIEDFAGGLEFQNGQRIGAAFSNYDGLSRTDRVRYDTPVIAGFKLSASWTDDNEWDIALRYAQKFGAHKVAAAISYVDGERSQGFSSDHQVSGSGSILFGNGLNFTIAAGMQDDEGTGAAQRNTFFVYGKAGWIFDLFEWGHTAIAVDIANVANEARSGDDAWAYGAFIVQKIDWVGTELYAGLRIHEIDHMAPVLVAGTNFTAVASDDPDAVVAFMTGARIKF